MVFNNIFKIDKLIMIPTYLRAKEAPQFGPNRHESATTSFAAVAQDSAAPFATEVACWAAAFAVVALSVASASVASASVAWKGAFDFAETVALAAAVPYYSSSSSQLAVDVAAADLTTAAIAAVAVEVAEVASDPSLEGGKILLY
jgi:hypothetical protein